MGLMLLVQGNLPLICYQDKCDTIRIRLAIDSGGLIWKFFLKLRLWNMISFQKKNLKKNSSSQKLV